MTRSMAEPLFDGVYYSISSSIDDSRRKQLSALLEANGAQPVSANDAKLTHFITNTLPHPESQSFDDLPSNTTAHLVTPLWIERTVVIATKQDPACYSPDPTLIFSGVTAAATDLSSSDLEVLSAGITALGGQWRTTLTKEVTHLFALSTGSAKYETAMHFQKNINIKILVPHWFDDSVRLGMRGLPTESYEWPQPTVFKVGWDNLQPEDRRSASSMSPEKKALYDTALASPADDASLPKTTTRNIWKGRKILLASSLELTESQRSAHEVDIRREGGVVVQGDENVEEADILITRYRTGPTYVKAYRLKKTIGSLPWLWYVRSTGKISRPSEQILHYPVPKKPIEGFSKHLITITNYTGKDREYLKKLIATLGGEFTPSMSGKNTVVIAAYIHGTKTQKAISWGIPVVNHLWLEDCFINWRCLSPSNEKFSCFPPGVDFGTLLGEKGIGRIGYDISELEAMERDVEAEERGEDAVNGVARQVPEEPRLSGRSMKEVEDAIAEHEPDGDVAMNGVGDVSAGAYLDLDIQDGMDIDKDNEPQPSSSKVKTPSFKGKAKPAVKKPEAEPSPPKAKSKPKPKPAPVAESEESEHEEYEHKKVASAKKKKPPPRTVPPRKSELLLLTESESEVEEPPAKAANYSTQKRKVENTTSDEEEEDDDGVGMKQPSTSKSKGPAAPKSKRPAISDVDVDMEDAETVAAKVNPPKRPRGRPRKSAPDEDGEMADAKPEEGRKAEEKAEKRGRGRPRKVPASEPEHSEVEETSPPKKSRGRPRKVPLGESEKGQVDEPKSTTKSRMQPKATPNAKKRPLLSTSDDASELEVLPGPSKKAAGASAKPKSSISAKGKNVALATTDSEVEVLEQTLPMKARPATTTPGKEKKRLSLDTDSDESERNEDHSPKTPAKLRRTGSQSRKAAVPIELDTDVEDEERPAPRKPLTRNASQLNQDVSKPSSPAKPGRTPKRRLSVLLPTKEQVYSASQEKGEEIFELRRNASMTSVKSSQGERLTRRNSMSTKAQKGVTDSPKRDRPRKGRSPSPSTSSSRSSSPAPVPKKTPKSRRPATPEPGPSRRDDITETPATSRRTSSKRSAATKATKKLRDEVMPDMNNFQKQLKRGNMKGSWEINERDQSKADGSKAKVKGKKRLSMGDGGSEDEEEHEDAPDRKKRRLSGARASTAKKDRNRVNAQSISDEETDEEVKGKKPGKSDAKALAPKSSGKLNQKDPSSIVIMTTQVTLSDDVKKSMGRLGVQFTTNPAECTHLVTKALVRTEKFLCAMARAPIVVTDKWVETCAYTKRLIIEDDFLLHDPEHERKFGFKLDEALERARENGGKLFSGMTFYITPRVPVETKLLKNVIAAGGGKVGSGTPTVRILKAIQDRFVISCVDDKSIWRPLAEAGFPIFNQELILTGMLKQKIDWDSDASKVAGSY